MHKNFIIVSALLGGLAVILGAFGAHGLQSLTKDDELLHGYQTAVQYQFYHAFALLILGLLGEKLSAKLLRIAGICFILGVIFFCGSLYGLTFLKLHNSSLVNILGPITPVGGLLF